MRIVAILIGIGLGIAATPSFANETITYSYDALGRLVKVVHDGSVNDGQQTSYTQDLADNRTNVTVTGASH